MAIGFRKSLFGFNAADVMGYIETAQRANAEKLSTLETENEDLKASFEELNVKFNDICSEKNALAEQLREYTKKYEEINRLSENIGKLYLVAQANAQAIMKNSNEIGEQAAAEAERNLTSIADAQQSLNSVKQELLDTTTDFCGRISELIASLEDARGRIAEVSSDSKQRSADFNAVYDSLKNE